MSEIQFPNLIPNILGKHEVQLSDTKTFDKIDPHSGKSLCRVVRSDADAVKQSIELAKLGFREWANVPAVRRGEVLFEIVDLLKKNRSIMAKLVSLETGKSLKDADGEVGAAISQGLFMAGEGQRLFGRVATSAVSNRYPIVVREPVGIAGLIISANTPIANVAWKVFPALVCGNAAILKASEDAPLSAWFFGKLVAQTSLPHGALSVIHGLGEEAGAALVRSPDVGVVSFTGSTAVGKIIARESAERLAKLSLELGGKNPLVVCDDADMENALKWSLLSAFSNAGQRCASASRIIVFESVYEKFRDELVMRAKKLKLGNKDSDDYGPVINRDQMDSILGSITAACRRGARVLTGGVRCEEPELREGFYISPTVIEGAAVDDEISTTELFGPVTCLYRARDFRHALELANSTPYGLTAAIHTRDFNRANEFCRSVQAGVAVVNAGTYGSEAHMPFGGVKLSGNGTREPGPEALDIYSNLKVISQVVDPSKV